MAVSSITLPWDQGIFMLTSRWRELTSSLKFGWIGLGKARDSVLSLAFPTPILA